MKRIPAVAILALLATSAPAAAQSLFSTGGLGVPVAPLDARSRALGGIGVGLYDFNASLVNPAEIAGVRFRGAVAAYQPMATNVELGGASDEIGGTRFPLLRVLYPLGTRFVAGLGYGSLFDQSWAAVQQSEITVGGEAVPVRDEVDSRGGIAQLQATLAYEITPALAVGIGGGVYTGELQRRTLRTFQDTASTLSPFESRTTWGYGGRFFVAGARWDVARAVRVGASYQRGGDLDVDSIAGGAQDRTDALPDQVSVGVSATLAPRISATAGLRRSMWSGDQSDVTEFGVGTEYDGFSLGGRRLPLRLGYNRADLPYGPLNGAAGNETSIAFGAGARFAMTEEGPLARVDASLERGTREAGGISPAGNTLGLLTLKETFWRFSLSLAVFGR